MSRLLFEKKGNAIWISHLDLMRVFQRSFRRAGYLLKHTGGFNQHAYVSLALPLSVGTESSCEVLEYELEQPVAAETLIAALNKALPDGIRVLKVSENGMKFSKLAYLQARVYLEYDAGIPAGAEHTLGKLFCRPSIEVEKTSKKGVTVVDLKPLIQSMEISRRDANTLVLDTVVCAQNPGMNPLQLGTAIETFAPALKPDFLRCARVGFFTAEMETFL